MSDLSTYLSKKVGIAISNEIIAHILWADDLILFSDSPTGLQKQLNGLLKFCSNNKIIVNETKTKTMCFGTDEPFNVYFNGKLIEQVHQYKYLGVLVRSVNRPNQDIFADNYRVISDKSRKAAFGMNRCIQNLPPSIRFDMFDTLVRPVLTYGSDVWGMSKSGQGALDKVFLHYARCTLGVKATTCNVIAYGGCGKYPPSIFCQVNVLCYLHRLLTLQGGKIIKSVFCTLNDLHDQGFLTWVTKAYDLAGTYNIDMDEGATLSTKQYKTLITERVKSTFRTNWYADLQVKPLLRSYRLYKREFTPEYYLDCITLPKYRVSISKIRASSHDLEIERGRYTRPKIDPDHRLCAFCLEIENEERFVTTVKLMMLSVNYYLQGSVPSSRLSHNLITMKNLYISCHVMTDRYWHDLENFYTNHLIFATRKSMGHVFLPNSNILLVSLTMYRELFSIYHHEEQ